MKFKIPDGSLTGNDKEMIGVLTKYFYKIYNHKVKVDRGFINNINLLPTIHKISRLITIDNLDKVLKKLS